jgi:hypothetical protein
MDNTFVLTQACRNAEINSCIAYRVLLQSEVHQYCMALSMSHITDNVDASVIFSLLKTQDNCMNLWRAIEKQILSGPLSLKAESITFLSCLLFKVFIEDFNVRP